jgi:hypothetical protein
MPRIASETLQAAQTTLRRQKIFTFERLLTLLHCSVRSGRAKLKEWGVYHSYNHNGRYYAMRSVPRFDENGLWRHGNVFFSRYGNLKTTVIELVTKSPSGLTGKRIGEMLGLQPRSFLHHFKDVPGIRREKHGGVYVYFSDDADIYPKQTHRIAAAGGLGKESISDVDAIAILVALIQQYEIPIEAMGALPEIQARGISTGAVEQFLQHHGLVKKTPPTQR